MAFPSQSAPRPVRLFRLAALLPLVTVLGLALMVLPACEDEEAAAPPPSAPAAPVAPEAEAPLSYEQRRDQARAEVLAGGDVSELLGALLAEQPEDELLWVLVESAGSTPEAAAAWLGRWSSLPDAGTRSHALTRAQLALAAGQPKEAWDAAFAARADMPEAAAGLLAEAARRGALRPGEVDPAVDALVALAVAPGGRVSPAVLEQAAAVAGWRAALLRAEVYAAAGEWTSALDEYEKVVQDVDPRAKVRGSLGRLGVAQATAGGGAGTQPATIQPETVAAWCGEAVDAALAAGDPVALLSALQRSAVLHERQGAAGAHHQLSIRARGGMAAPKGPSGAALALEHARASRRVGALSVAADESAAALPVAGPALVDDVAWMAGEAAFWTHDWPALDAAWTAAGGHTKAALGALRQAAQGAGPAAVASAPKSGLPEAELARLHLAIAERAGEAGVPAAQRAVTHAEASGDRRLIVEARLLAEALLRDTDPAAAAKMLAPLGAGREAVGAGLASELAVRAALAGVSTAAVPSEGPAVWAAILGARAAVADAPRWSALAAWQRAALAPTEDGAEAAVVEAVGGLPLHRVDALRSGTALDGSQGAPTGTMLAELAKLEPKEGVIGVALAALEVAHRIDSARETAASGAQPLAGLAPDVRRGLADAAAQLRVAVTDYHVGVGPFPDAQLDALAALEAAAVRADRGVARAVMGAVPTLADMQVGAPRTALLSYAASGGRLWGVVWNGAGSGQIKDLGLWSAVTAQAVRHRQALVAGSDGGRRASHAAGDQLRVALLEPFAQTLAGQGRFAVVTPAPLRDVQLTTLPDNREGLRWLASIRTIGQLDRLSRIQPVVEAGGADAEQFSPAYLVMQVKQIPAPVIDEEEAAAGKPAPKPAPAADDAEVVVADAVLPEAPAFVPPPDVAAGQKKYDAQYSAVYVAEQATLSQWSASSPRAQVIHISAADAAAGGGFALSDGTLSLDAVRSAKLIAQLVVIAAPGTPEVQAARARAFLDAGARAVLVVAWPVPDAALDLLMEGYFSALLRDRTPVKALSDARDNLLRDADSEARIDNPGLWGTLIVYGLP